MNMLPDARVVMKFTQVALSVMSARALTWATMLITAGLFGYALYAPDAMRIGTATIFSLLVFWRVTWLEKINDQKGEQHGSAAE